MATNPYQIDTKGLISSAMSAIPNANPGTTADKVQQINPATAAQTDWNVNGLQTVQGQLDGILAKESPLMQRAATKATQTMAQRGLVNSSMAIGAGQAAMVDAATPIAQQDAATYANSAKSNADAANNTSQFNAQQTNQVNANNQAVKTDALKSDAQMGLQAQLANQDTAKSLQLSGMDAQVRTQLAGIEAQYKQGMQTSQSMAATYQSLVDNINKVMLDTTLDAGAKQAAIGNLTSLYNNALQIQQNISGLNLGSLLDPTSFGSTAAPAQAPTQAPDRARGVIAPGVGWGVIAPGVGWGPGDSFTGGS